MNLQYVSDDRGKITGILIPIRDWEALREQLLNVDAIPSHRDELVEAFDQLKQIRAGKMAKPKLSDFLNEL